MQKRSSKHTLGFGLAEADVEDEDYAADLREAFTDRQEQVAEELSDMKLQEDEWFERELDRHRGEFVGANEKRRAWLAMKGGETSKRVEALDNMSRGEAVEWFNSDVDEFMSRRFHVDGCSYCAESKPKSLGEWVAHMCGAYNHAFEPSDLHVVSRSAALLDAEGRRALGMFALLGDAAVTYAVVDKCFKLGYNKSRAADARSRCTNWAVLAGLFVEAVPAGYVQFPSGIDPGVTRSGGEALEALFGLVANDLGMPSAMEFAHSIGLFSKYKF